MNVQSCDDITDEEMDERYQQSIELSYEEIQNVMEKVGFSIKESNRICTPYTDNMCVIDMDMIPRRSMMTTLFRGVMFVAEKTVHYGICYDTL